MNTANFSSPFRRHAPPDGTFRWIARLLALLAAALLVIGLILFSEPAIAGGGSLAEQPTTEASETLSTLRTAS